MKLNNVHTEVKSKCGESGEGDSAKDSARNESRRLILQLPQIATDIKTQINHSG